MIRDRSHNRVTNHQFNTGDSAWICWAVHNVGTAPFSDKKPIGSKIYRIESSAKTLPLNIDWFTSTNSKLVGNGNGWHNSIAIGAMGFDSCRIALDRPGKQNYAIVIQSDSADDELRTSNNVYLFTLDVIDRSNR